MQHDWLACLRAHVQDAGPEIGLGELGAGDVLVVETRHTRYALRWREGGTAELETGRSDRPSGEVRVLGCTFGASSSIKPDVLFTGGNLEFWWAGGSLIHRTTAIRSLHLARRLPR
jgi:hypothetical protein